MPAQENLGLQHLKLKAHQNWTLKGDQLFFIFLKDGAAVFDTSGIVQRLSVGDVLVMKGSSGGKLCAGGQGEFGFWYFSLTLEMLFPLFESGEIAALQNVSDGFKPFKYYPAVSEVAKECHRRLVDIPAEFNLDHRCNMIRVAAAVLTFEFNTSNSQRISFGRPESQLMRIFEKLTSVEIINLSVGEMAAKFRCSRRHLNRLFHDYFGASVAALKMEIRLIRAVTLLRDPDAKINRVAEDCGFNQTGLFHTCFKRRFGVSPGQWRKDNLNANNLSNHPEVNENNDNAPPLPKSHLYQESEKINPIPDRLRRSSSLLADEVWRVSPNGEAQPALNGSNATGVSVAALRRVVPS